MGSFTDHVPPVTAALFLSAATATTLALYNRKYKVRRKERQASSVVRLA